MEYGIEAEALSFMPDYVASHFKDCEDSAVGRYFSKDVSFEIKLKLSGSSNYDGLDLQNNYEVEKGVSRQILDTLEKTVEEHRFFGHFPLKGLCLEVVSAHSPTGKSNAHAKNTALNRALHKLLYQNNNMGLYEPWVNIEVKSKRDDVISELTMNLMSSPFLEKYPYEGYDHKQKCSVVNFELPFYWLIQGEEFITGILKHYAHDISVESYKAVPYGRAVKVIRDVCGFKENEESSVSNERRVEPIYGHRSIKAAFARELSQQELTMPIMAGVNSDISLVLGKDNSIYWNKNRPDCFGGARL
jgi:hypothetical protein